jgi:hypothetical protein
MTRWHSRIDIRATIDNRTMNSGPVVVIDYDAGTCAALRERSTT